MQHAVLDGGNCYNGYYRGKKWQKPNIKYSQFDHCTMVR